MKKSSCMSVLKGLAGHVCRASGALILAFVAPGCVPGAALQVLQRAGAPPAIEEEHGFNQTYIMRLKDSAIYLADARQRHLTYWINIKSFCGSKIAKAEPCGHAKTVAAALAAAAKDWMDACPACGITIAPSKIEGKGSFEVKYVEQTEIRKGNDIVRVHPNYIAHAFFPSSGSASHILRISPRYFAAQAKFDLAGVLRHELGHILGFTHEHARADAKTKRDCGFDSGKLPPGTQSAPLTVYDPTSIMHYPCAGQAGKTMFVLSPLDIEGLNALYGSGPGGK